MKKTIAVLSALISTAVFAVGGDLLVSFSTPGPDKYADGKLVVDGESYALIYTKADGSQEVVLNFPGAKDHKCPTVVYIVDEVTAAKYKGGSWGVYLLDTRDLATDPTGLTLFPLDEKGAPTQINVKAAVAESVVSAGGFDNMVASAAVGAGAYDLEGANVPKPVVTGIKVLGAKVHVTVANTVPFVGYTLNSGSDVVNFTPPANAELVPGKQDATEEITLVTDKKDGAQFFKVSTAK